MTVYTLWGQPASPGTPIADGATYTMGVQFSVSVSGATATAVWFYSPSGAGVLPDRIGLYQVTGAGTGTLVTSNVASWSGGVASGWVRAAFTSPPSLTPNQAYKACILKSGGGNFYASTSHYWDTGAGSGGITNGPLSAPNKSDAASTFQDTFTGPTGTLVYPTASFNASNYWVDAEVTVSSSQSSVLMALFP